ncbi:hypothetical protein CYQ88_07325 [Hydrogenovibrio sp. SC-1]|uniref:HD domain-containing phosphohydrolase n=1 Tax=Hydrogenovibrio sp. SC-1 TaxID=2065820 RepID=UPI000C79F1C3|nr:HD domain-containing phosphohydrolase [Hydrogenovibrio sp. SC-1]PLA74183.1 hypothetical protein CYQ88_07325 [Hydrogenovibrio sp. SC-1]
MFKRKQRFSIKVTIFTHLLLMIAITSLALIGIQSYYNHQYANQSVTERFQQLFERIELKNKILDQQSRALLSFIEEYPSLKSSTAEHQSQEAILQTLVKTLTNFPEAYAIYIGHADGRFFEVINMNHSPDLWQLLKAPKLARWGVIEVSPDGGDQAYQHRFYNEALQLIDQRRTATNYVPAERPWYQGAIKSTRIYKSNPYLFWHLKSPGITYSKRIRDTQSVVAVDYTVQHMTQLLEKFKPTPDSHVVLFNEAGQRILESSPRQIQEPLPTSAPMKLSVKEQALIENTPELKVSNQLNWAPFDFVRNGQPQGFSVDVMRLIAAKTGLRLQFVNDYTWQQILKQFEAGRLDMVHSIFHTVQRAEIGSFSDAYYPIREYLITHKDVGDIIDDKVFESLTFALVKGWKNTEYLLNRYKNLKFKLYDDTLSRMIAVNKGEADALIDNSDTYARLKAQYQLNQLKLNRPMDELMPLPAEKLRLMLHPDYHYLLPILNRALAAISQTEFQTLKQRWQLNGQASLDRMSLPDRLYYELLNRMPLAEAKTFYEFNLDSQRYLSAYSLINYTGSEKNYLAVFVPKSALMAPFNQQRTMTLWAVTAVLLIILWLAHYSSTVLVKPIRELMHRNQLVEKRNFDQVTPVKTYIQELDELSQTFLKVADSFRNHEKEQDALLKSFIELVAKAIDEKSPYTGAHCARVPQLALMILDKAKQEESQPFKNFQMDENEQKAFEMGAWLHDCGKITTPDYVLDKSTKLDTFYNRIHEIRTRFEVLWRDAEIQYYRSLINQVDKVQATAKLKAMQDQLQHEFALVAQANLATNGVDAELCEKLTAIGSRDWQRHFDNRLGLSDIQLAEFPAKEESLPATEKLLDDKPEHCIARRHFDEQAYHQEGFKLPVPSLLYNLGELHNLTIQQGTLSPEERFKVSEHVMMTLRMLEHLPFPDIYQGVATYAGTHHEKLDGSGYPRQLDASQLSIPERIMAIADIFEALTAPDRPYKKANKLSVALNILLDMCQSGQLDKEVFALLLTSGVYQQYAQQYLKPEQIDEVDIDRYLNALNET